MNLEEEMNKVAIERVVDFEVKKGHVVNETEKTIDYEDAIRIAKAYAEAMCKRQREIDWDYYLTYWQEVEGGAVRTFNNAPLATEEK